MNIIQTNFTSRADEIIRNSVIGGTAGSIVGLVTRMGDQDISHVDALAKGGLGGALGATIGGLISNDQYVGPAVGTVIGGILGSKLAKRKSIKDFVKRVYADAASENEVSQLMPKSNPFLFSDTQKYDSLESKEESLERDISDLNEKIRNESSEQRDISDDIKTDKERLNNYISMNLNTETVMDNIDNNTSTYNDSKEESLELKEERHKKQAQLIDVRKRKDNISSNGNLRESTAKGVIRDHTNDMKSAFGMKSYRGGSTV